MSDSPELSAVEQIYLETAFKFAQDALRNQEVPVGCIFVDDSTSAIIATGRNEVNETRNATRHAEFVCLDQIVQHCRDSGRDLSATLEHCSVYVTVEPCIMCAAMLYQLRVKAVVFGCRNDRFGGETVFDVATVLTSGQRTVVKGGGYRAAEAMDLLKAFYQGTNPSAPPDKVKIKDKK